MAGAGDAFDVGVEVEGWGVVGDVAGGALLGGGLAQDVLRCAGGVEWRQAVFGAGAVAAFAADVLEVFGEGMAAQFGFVGEFAEDAAAGLFVADDVAADAGLVEDFVAFFECGDGVGVLGGGPEVVGLGVAGLALGGADEEGLSFGDGDDFAFDLHAEFFEAGVVCFAAGSEVGV